MIFSRYPGKYPLLFQVSPGRWRKTAEMTVTSLCAMLVGQSFHLPFVDLYPIFIIILWKDNRVLNIILALVFGTMVLFLCSLVLLETTLGANNNSAKFLAQLAVAFLFFFLTIGSKLGTLLGPICGLLTTYGMFEVNRVPQGEVITEGLLYFLESVEISCLAIILGSLVLVRSPKVVLCEEIAWHLRVCADLLRGENREIGSWTESRALLEKGALPLLTKVKLASFEKIWPSEMLNRLRQASLHAFSCLALSRMAVREIGWSRIKSNPQADFLAERMAEMADVFDRGDLAFLQNSAPSSLPFSEESHPALWEISEQLSHFSEKSAVPFPQKPKTGFILPNAFKDPQNYRYAAKGTLTVALSMCLYLLLDWPGVHTCVITCFIVGLPTVGAMVTKQFLRISGTLAGSVYVFWGLIFALPYFTSVVQFLLLLGGGFLVAGWLKSGPERLSYAGFQIAVVLALSEAASLRPSIDLTTPRDRIIGIWIGLFLTYAIFTRLWPVSALTKIGPVFGKCFSALEQQQKSDVPVMRLFWASAAQGALGDAHGLLLDAHAEKVPLRLRKNALVFKEKAVIQGQRLMEILLLPPTGERVKLAGIQRNIFKQALLEAGFPEIPEKVSATKESQKNPAS